MAPAFVIMVGVEGGGRVESETYRKKLTKMAWYGIR
jgi:hypothetical protein